MKILYLTDQTFLHGGIEKVLSQKANYFADICKDEVTIVTYRQRNKVSSYHLSNRICKKDLGVDYDISKSYFHPENFQKFQIHFTRLKNEMRQLKPDVIISCSFGPDFYFLPLLEKQIPKIKEFHSSRYFYDLNRKTFKSKVVRKMTSYFENKYDEIVVLNDSEKGFYNNSKITVIPNPAEISGERAQLKSKKIIAAGRISPVKNFVDIIYAFSLINDEFQNWEVHFYGEDYSGTQLKLENIVKKLNLDHQIKFKGITSDLKKEMEGYSIYAMTSETECFPMVLLEALSVGMPIISYDCPTGPKHILTAQEDSFLTPYQNIDLFSEKLKVLMQNEEIRKKMGNSGIENVQRFNITKVMHQWKKLFESLV